MSLNLEPPEEGSDELANKEAAGYANRDLDRENAEKEHGRSQHLKDNALYVAIGVLWLVALLFVAALVIFALHMLTPLTWLPPERIAEIRALLGGAFASGLLSAYAKKYFSK